ncbi:MAG TPA: hypothetical protein VFZ11_06315 [Gemmatimonadaceae bacterium]
MKRVHLLVLGSLLASVSCQGDTMMATGPDPASAALDVAGTSSCRVVSGVIAETGTFPTFSGTISGDIEGTSATTLSFDLQRTGAVIHAPAERTIVVTGGSIPELIGRTLHGRAETLSIFDADPLIRLNEHYRLDDGTRRGNLTAHGFLDQSVFPWALALQYRGVVCP